MAASRHSASPHPAGVIGYFDDNSFTLVPGEKNKVSFTVQTSETGGKWVDDDTATRWWDQTTNE